MKIKFKNEKEKEIFIGNACVFDVNGPIYCLDICDDTVECEECFRLCGIELEVENENHI